MAESLLRACPNLKIIASSREPLGISGETTFHVPVLSLPDIHQLPPIETLPRFEAVRLFVERAHTALPSFVLTNDNALTIVQICQRLDGIPLAIELAAARVKMLKVQQIVARLDDRFRLLTGGSRTAMPRQQTLQALIDWSWDLLSNAERTLLQRLSVFAGGWTLEAAEGVCGDQGDNERLKSEVLPLAVVLPPSAVLDVLAQLVNKSLVSVEYEQGAVTRYHLLETIREYARERLIETGTEAVIQHQHAEYYLAVTERAESELRGPQQLEWLDQLETEHDNLRAALRWCVENRAVEKGLRLGAAIERFWQRRGYWTEGRERLLEVLALADGQLRTAVKAKALRAAGRLARSQGDMTAMRAMGEESLAICHELGDRKGLAESLLSLVPASADVEAGRALCEEALNVFREIDDTDGIASALGNLGVMAYRVSDYATAQSLFEEALSIQRRLADKWGVALTLGNLGSVARDQKDYARARACEEESLSIFQELRDKPMIAMELTSVASLALIEGDYATARSLSKEALVTQRELNFREAMAWSLQNLGDVAHVQGDLDAARSFYEQFLAIRREIGERESIGWALVHLGRVVYDQGYYSEAQALFRDSLSIAQQEAQHLLLVFGVEGFASLAAAQGQPERAARLAGVAATYREVLKEPLVPEGLRLLYERRLEPARRALEDQDWRAAWNEGREMGLDQAVIYAQAEAT